MSKSTGAIRGRRQRLRIPRPVQRAYLWDKKQDARLSELWTAGMAAVHIALALTEEFKRPFSKNSVIGRANRLAVPSRKVVCRESKPRIRIRLSRPIVRTKAPPPPGENHAWQLFGELTSKTCHFVQDEPRGFDTLMCGLPTSNGSYCEYHHWMTHKHAPSGASEAGPPLTVPPIRERPASITSISGADSGSADPYQVQP